MRLRDIVRLCVIAISGLTCLAASAATVSTYNPRETFAPLDFDPPPNRYRSADGTPGPDFWRNRADYTIHAALDPATHSISGTVADPLHQQQPGSARRAVAAARAEPLRAGFARGTCRSGATGHAVGSAAGLTAGDDPRRCPRDRRQAHRRRAADRQRHARPAPASGAASAGGTAVVDIRYHYTVPKEPWGGRTGWMDSQNGPIYSIAQWYPRMAVYDDLRGWDTLPYLQQEFYLEYGDFDYSVTVPANMIVAGSGELQNPDEVLSPQQRARLAQARQSDKTVMIRSRVRAVRPADRHAHLALHACTTAATWPSAPRRPSSGTPRGSICPAATRRWPCRSIRPRRRRGAARPNI